MVTSKISLKKKFKPNSHIVKVWHGVNKRYYPVNNPGAYIAKCIADGKRAEYCGITDNDGYLIKNL